MTERTHRPSSDPMPLSRCTNVARELMQWLLPIVAVGATVVLGLIVFVNVVS